MLSFTIRRLLFAIPTLLVISLIIFLLLDLSPGDPTSNLPLTIPAEVKEQIRVSLAMAMSLNPKLRVIRILDGSLLDADNLALITEAAVAAYYQVWIERVSDPSETAVVIEDGEVA